MSANVGACAVAGLGGLGNEAKRNAKTDQLRPVPRHNVNKENERNEDTEPGYCTSTVLVAVWPSLHFIRSLVFCPPLVTQIFLIRSCGGVFSISNFLHLHYTEHTL